MLGANFMLASKLLLGGFQIHARRNAIRVLMWIAAFACQSTLPITKEK